MAPALTKAGMVNVQQNLIQDYLIFDCASHSSCKGNSLYKEGNQGCP